MWQFFWYPDGTEDPWRTWYVAQSGAVQGRHDFVIKALASNQQWREPLAKKMKGYDDLIEIILDGKVQHRFFGFYGIGLNYFTIVLPCIHKGKVYTPKNAIDTAVKRIIEVKTGRKRVIRCDIPK